MSIVYCVILVTRQGIEGKYAPGLFIINHKFYYMHVYNRIIHNNIPFNTALGTTYVFFPSTVELC